MDVLNTCMCTTSSHGATTQMRAIFNLIDVSKEFLEEKFVSRGIGCAKLN